MAGGFHAELLKVSSGQHAENHHRSAGRTQGRLCQDPRHREAQPSQTSSTLASSSTLPRSKDRRTTVSSRPHAITTSTRMGQGKS